MRQQPKAGSTPTRPQEFWDGVRAITPLMVGAIPFGIIFGAVAVTGALSPAATVAMSAFVFAGAAQFVAAGMIAGGAATWLIVATTFIVNLRHALYGTSLAPHMRRLPQRWLALLGFLLVDEVYLFAIRRYTNADPSPYKHWYYLGAGSTIYVNWQLSTWIGVWAGQSIADPRAWGLDFALPVTFIGLLVPTITRRSVLWCVIAAGVAAVMLRGLPNQMGLLIATLVGIAAGMLTEAPAAQSMQPLPPESPAAAATQTPNAAD